MLLSETDLYTCSNTFIITYMREPCSETVYAIVGVNSTTHTHRGKQGTDGQQRPQLSLTVILFIFPSTIQIHSTRYVK